jgi:hypothetical protein
MRADADPLLKPCTAFDGARRIAAGALAEVALAARGALDRSPEASILVFDDETGAVIDLDLRGSADEIVARLRNPAPLQPEPLRARGRPKLGVVAREVTLLPRHWEWLAGEPGGVSAALRRLVEAARAASAASGTVEGTKRRRRAAQEAAYRFMHAIAGDRRGFEEAARALFADDQARFKRHIAPWPPDIRKHALRLSFPDRT